MKYNYSTNKKSLYKHIAAILLLAFSSIMMSSCMDIKDRKTTIEIADNNRHYYPILTGQELEVSFIVKNTGTEPLMVTDIVSSCGCIKLADQKGAFAIPPKQERPVSLVYNSTKNIGYVKHYVSLYGNFVDAAYQDFVFDVNVVPNALYTQDYEELYRAEESVKGVIKYLVDGNESQRGYHLD